MSPDPCLPWLRYIPPSLVAWFDDLPQSTWLAAGDCPDRDMELIYKGTDESMGGGILVDVWEEKFFRIGTEPRRWGQRRG